MSEAPQIHRVAAPQRDQERVAQPVVPPEQELTIPRQGERKEVQCGEVAIRRITRRVSPNTRVVPPVAHQHAALCRDVEEEGGIPEAVDGAVSTREVDGMKDPVLEVPQLASSTRPRVAHRLPRRRDRSCAAGPVHESQGRSTRCVFRKRGLIPSRRDPDAVDVVDAGRAVEDGADGPLELHLRADAAQDAQGAVRSPISRGHVFEHVTWHAAGEGDAGQRAELGPAHVSRTAPQEGQLAARRHGLDPARGEPERAGHRALDAG